ncbi:MAG: hypothetical protein ACHQVS_01455 [Candidatus Babeliales bacterium]
MIKQLSIIMLCLTISTAYAAELDPQPLDMNKINRMLSSRSKPKSLSVAFYCMPINNPAIIEELSGIQPEKDRYAYAVKKARKEAQNEYCQQCKAIDNPDWLAILHAARKKWGTFGFSEQTINR